MRKNRKAMRAGVSCGVALAAAAVLMLTGCRNQEDVVKRAASVQALPQDDAQVTMTEESFDPERVQSFVPAKKEELVSVQADAFGMPEKIEVSGILSGFSKESGDWAQDISGLSELKNSKGEEDCHVTEDGTVYWENLGENIQYEGIGTEELPVEVQVTYWLDGEETDLQSMKGKSGDVRIRFDYVNHRSETVPEDDGTREMIVPYLAVSMAVLPEDVFTDVEVSEGKLMTFAGQQMAVGFALPGLQEDLALEAHEDTADLEIPSSVEISAHAEAFQLDFTATLLTAGLFAELNEEKLDTLTEKTGNADDLEEAGKELQEGADALSDGAAQLQEYLLQYINGVNQTTAAVAQIHEGLAGYDLSSLSLLSGQLQQAAGLAELGPTLQQAAGLAELGPTLQQAAGLAELGSTLQQTAALAALADPLQQLGGLAGTLGQMTQLSDLATQLEAAAAAHPEAEDVQMLAAWAEPLRQYAEMNAWAGSLQGMAQYADAVRALSGLSDAGTALGQLSALADAGTALGQLSGLTDAASAVAGMAGGLAELQTGVSQLNDGMKALPAAGQSLYDGMTTLTNGTAEFRDSIQTFRQEGIQELSDYFRNDLGDLLQRIRDVRQADLQARGYTPAAEGQEVSAVYLIETKGTD